MKISVQIIIDPENNQPVTNKLISEFKREDLTCDTLGLALGESKSILKNIQSEFAQSQVDHYIHKHQTCAKCHQLQKIKEHSNIVYRTLFGKLNLRNPRFYKCPCQKGAKSISPLSAILPERMSPELQFLQTKWASLVSYGITSNILEDVLPLQSNISTIFNTVVKTAKRLDAQIGEEKHCYINGCEAQWQELPHPDSPLAVGIDGGYIHAREGSNRKAGWFEAIVGKSLQEDKPSKRFGFVSTYDDRPKSRLNTMLQKQGLQMNQDITFLSDGGDTVRDIQTFISPRSEHLLDWFHITMKITVMKQMVKGLSESEQDKLEKLESIKWNIWHGNVDKTLSHIESFCEDIDTEKLDKESKKYKLYKWADEFYNYIESNRNFIPNYADRYRYGDIISTSFVESTVNEVISKRMVKKQQMRWTKKGAHNMIQVRISTLNNELRDTFCDWYPSMKENSCEDLQLTTH